MQQSTWTISVNDASARRWLNRTLDNTKNLRPAMSAIGESVIRSTKKRFVIQEAPDGTPWAKLSPKYKARKKRNTGKILFLRGNLANKYYQKPTNNNVIISTDGSTIKYAATHQFGDDSRNILARPFMGLNNKDITIIQKILRNHIIP